MHARNLPPSLIRDIRLVRLQPVARLLFISIQGVADRCGRMEDNHDQISYDVGLMDFDCDKLLGDLQNAGLVKRYEVDGVRFIQIIDWHKFQRPHHTERQSRIPELHQNTKEAKEPEEEKKIDPEKAVDSQPVSRQVEICKLAKAKKMYGVNPSHLKLAELSEKHGGYPSDAIWEHAFAIAQQQGGGQFAYAITTAFGEWQKSISRGANKPVARKNTPSVGAGGSNPYEIKPEGVKYVGRGIEKFEQPEEEVA